jgi:hypothetical protein
MNSVPNVEARVGEIIQCVEPVPRVTCVAIGHSMQAVPNAEARVGEIIQCV